jgi:hypothetical protein
MLFGERVYTVNPSIVCQGEQNPFGSHKQVDRISRTEPLRREGQKQSLEPAMAKALTPPEGLFR